MNGNHDGLVPDKARVYRIGSEGSTVLVIENLLGNSQDLLHVAHQSSYSEPKVKNFPGIQAPTPNTYANVLIKTIFPLLRRTFGLEGWSIASTSSNFSLVTRPPNSLTPRQCIPHCDGTDDGVLALLHYLVPGGCFGTSFYRHRATGFERITGERRAQYRKALDDELRQSPPKGYITENSPLFEQTHAFEGRFNRLIVYQGNTLHCAQVPPDFQFNPTPHLGRLTANTFIGLRRHPTTEKLAPALSYKRNDIA